MRVLVVNTDYAEFLRWFYRQHPGLAEASYDEQMRARVETLFGVADFYTRSLRELGHEAWDVHANNAIMQRTWARENGLRSEGRRRDPRRVAQRAGEILRGSGARPGGAVELLPEILAAQVDHFRPDVLINQAMEEISPAILTSFRARVPILVGQHAATQLPPNREYSLYDLVVSSYPPTLKWFDARGVRTALNRLAFEPSVLSRLGPRELEHEVAFVGSFQEIHRSRVTMIEELCRQVPELRVWAPAMDQISPTSPIRRHYVGPAWGREMYEVLRRSRIVLNHHGDIAPYANNLRLFEATGVGALLLTDAKNDLSTVFVPGREVIDYGSAEECLQAIRFSQNDAAAAEAIAAAGQRRTLDEHTYRNRMKELLELVENHL
ncbi:MAG TPA: glycosyltransferase [Gaiellaceae bacterium]|nr:glycosyltransferase [Gaiellaceae bacterium]